MQGDVTSIESSAFSYCTNLESITIPSSVETIDEFAFRECLNIKTIKIPSKVTIIEDSLFYSCINLESIEIDGNLVSIKQKAFEGCTNLSLFYFDGTTDPTFVDNSFLNTQISNVYVSSSYGYETFCGFPVIAEHFYQCGPSLEYTIRENKACNQRRRPNEQFFL
ncbi:hypothetical protein M9Y10_038488 [Tritrichomonas musculus]|uniref:Surface antigen BspA-like n=1 Tax=Tritrichomonas musculus TaxID=1915356 RepID=A0ABR2K997_9EUKA